MASDIYQIMRLIRDIDTDHRHPFHDKTHPAHQQAWLAYSELCNWLSIELSRDPGGMDYDLSAQPPPLGESRPGFKPP